MIRAPATMEGWEAVEWFCGYAWGILGALLPVELVLQAFEDPLRLAQGLFSLLAEASKGPLWSAAEHLFRLVEQLARHGVTGDALMAWINDPRNTKLAPLREFLDWLKPIVLMQPFEPFEAGQTCGVVIGTIISVCTVVLGVAKLVGLVGKSLKTASLAAKATAASKGAVRASTQTHHAAPPFPKRAAPPELPAPLAAPSAELRQSVAEAEQTLRSLEKLEKPPTQVIDDAKKKLTRGKKKLAKGAADIAFGLTRAEREALVANRPVRFRKGVVDKVWENAKDADGKVFDPNTLEELTWDRSKNRDGSWDMGHLRRKSYDQLKQRFLNGKISRKQFLDEYNNPSNYRPEARSPNRGRRFQ